MPDTVPRRRIVNARLTDGRVVDVDVDDGGRIAAIRPRRAPAAPDVAEIDVDGSDDTGRPVVDEVDVEGWLLLPALAEPHGHVDKALTAERVPNPTGDLPGAIDAWIAAAAAGVFTHDDMVARVRRALDLLIVNGVTALRSHVNCGDGSGLDHLLATQEAIGPYQDLVDIQLVALMHSPVVGPDGGANRRWLLEAIDRGVDVVGGCPHLEPDGPAAVELLFSIAAEHGLPVDLHTDETLDPAALTLLDMVSGRDRVDGPVAASHCVSLGMQSAADQRRIARQVAAADIAVIPLPQTNLFLQGRDRPVATPRGLTAIHALGEAGVTIAAGADNVQDPFNLVGRSDPLETAALLVMAGHVMPDDAYDMVSNNVRRALGLDPVLMRRGDPADLMAIDAPSIRGAIADAPIDRKVFKGGRLVATSRSDRTVLHAR